MMKILFVHVLLLFMFCEQLNAQAGLIIGGAASSTKTFETPGQGGGAADTTFIINDQFDTWSGGANPNAFPTGTTLTGNDAGSYFDETAADGSAGTGYLYHDDDGGDANISWGAVLTTSTWYAVEIKIEPNGGSYTFDGDLRVRIGGGTAQNIDVATTGTHTIWFNSGDNTIVRLESNSGTAQYVVDYLKVWEDKQFLSQVASLEEYFAPHSIVNSASDVTDWTGVLSNYDLDDNATTNYPIYLATGGKNGDKAMQFQDATEFLYNGTLQNIVNGNQTDFTIVWRTIRTDSTSTGRPWEFNNAGSGQYELENGTDYRYRFDLDDNDPSANTTAYWDAGEAGGYYWQTWIFVFGGGDLSIWRAEDGILDGDIFFNEDISANGTVTASNFWMGGNVGADFTTDFFAIFSSRLTEYERTVVKNYVDGL